MSEYKDVTERFLRYVQVDTQSDPVAVETRSPSTEKQKDLARMLVQELQEMGAAEVTFDERYGYVYAVIPGNLNAEHPGGEQAEDTDAAVWRVPGFISHMDTAPDVSGKNVHPKLVPHYDGGDILLGQNGEEQWVLRPADFPELQDYIGKTLITTDGSTLLGADDKAGVAEIMSMAAYLLSHPECRHGKIVIAFTTDEEVGAGVDHFDLAQFGADVAYTVDGGSLGELEYENFNAASAVVTVKGRSVHPGDAKGKMKNAALMAMEFEQMLPREQRPELTEGYEGFFHLTEMEGDIEAAKLQYIIRDHDREKFEAKKDLCKTIAQELNRKYGAGSFTVELKDQYYNMAEKIRPYLFLIDQAREEMQKLGITPKVQPIRGGTDGARLSYEGLPCPNLCTGGMNYHGRYEFCCVESMEKITELLVHLAQRLSCPESER